jgi:hypothetical protein
MFGVSGSSNEGAMGLHFVNLDLVFDGVVGIIDARDRAVLNRCLAGAQINQRRRYLSDRRRLGRETPPRPPQLNGQLFHLFGSPNRFGLDPFYTLHVWAWKDNQTGPSRTGTERVV